jgi:Lar family restriction alleviation protein
LRKGHVVTAPVEVLLPCPFCGGGPKIVDMISYAHIYCSNRRCGAECVVAKTRKTAVKRWNTRAHTPHTDTQRIAKLEAALESIAMHPHVSRLDAAENQYEMEMIARKALARAGDAK